MVAKTSCDAYGAGTFVGTDGTDGATPSTDTTGRLATSMSPYWLLKLSVPPYDCCCENPPMLWSSVSYTVTVPFTSMARRRACEK